MPTISMFFGIVIRMYLVSKEHESAHFHAFYQDFKAIFSIDTCEMPEGDLPKKQRKLVEAWAELNRDELQADWKLAQNDELPFNIDPLK
jgi:hypothetical protein